MLFGEVWGRSFCRTIEKLVEVVQEYPAEVEHIFSPACVPLWRCAGCCGDENLECVPTDTYNVTMQEKIEEGEEKKRKTENKRLRLVSTSAQVTEVPPGGHKASFLQYLFSSQSNDVGNLLSTFKKWCIPR
ncbi:UNVERIFIED_CONTAM: hypothetical protein FKN15_070243 [Acipenser sinensis]